MKEEIFDRQIAYSLQRLEELWERTLALPKPTENNGRQIDVLPEREETLLWESLEQLNNSLAELQAASDELRHQNEELAASRLTVERERQRYQELFDFAPDAYIVTTESGKILQANIAAEKLLNVRRDRLIGKPLLVYIPSQERREFLHQLHLLQNGEEIRDWEIQILPRHGAENPVPETLCSAVPILDAQKQVVGMRWMLRDISDRKQAQQLMQKLFLLDQILCASDAQILLCDRNGKFLYASPNAARTLGVSQTDILGKTFQDLSFSSEIVEILDAQRQEVLIAKKPITAELSLPTAAGIKYFEYTISLSNSIDAVVVDFKDITKQKQAENEINKALEKQTEINELKTRFISIISHEFRNPLNKIFLSADLLKNYNDRWTQEQKKQQLNYILSAAKQTKRALDDLLLVNQAETGKLKFQPGLLDLEKFCRQIVEEMQATADKEQTITFTAQGHTSACLDEKLLRPVLTNLLSNAMKYSPSGSNIEFDLICENGEAILQIKDSGIGISPADRAKLFSSFYRGSNVGKIEGIGLGLSIVKQCVELHGGNIAIESEVGVGTKVTVTLPLGYAMPGDNLSGKVTVKQV
ncbi:MAG TPA: hypothetical protein DDW76_35120 [Cyanobacteria bacterium UBA11369]|nr:hypothetical protein [Cyanobacteria bacterium UBA11371]HBE32419.1 hypothetical protein [Cyanobacteria bacterium UBA11368]HBE53843.1 hypothetical protein [Cyanobacteria bacterium UBA11369]